MKVKLRNAIGIPFIQHKELFFYYSNLQGNLLVNTGTNYE